MLLDILFEIIEMILYISFYYTPKLAAFGIHFLGDETN